MLTSYSSNRNQQNESTLLNYLEVEDFVFSILSDIADLEFPNAKISKHKNINLNKIKDDELYITLSFNSTSPSNFDGNKNSTSAGNYRRAFTFTLLRKSSKKNDNQIKIDTYNLIKYLTENQIITQTINSFEYKTDLSQITYEEPIFTTEYESVDSPINITAIIDFIIPLKKLKNNI